MRHTVNIEAQVVGGVPEGKCDGIPVPHLAALDRTLGEALLAAQTHLCLTWRKALRNAV